MDIFNLVTMVRITELLLQLLAIAKLFVTPVSSQMVVCSDRNKNCKVWAANGVCASSKFTRTQLCKKTCGGCTVLATGKRLPIKLAQHLSKKACGSDGVTYKNMCEFNDAKLYNSKLYYVFSGECDNCDESNVCPHFHRRKQDIAAREGWVMANVMYNINERLQEAINDDTLVQTVGPDGQETWCWRGWKGCKPAIFGGVEVRDVLLSGRTLGRSNVRTKLLRRRITERIFLRMKTMECECNIKMENCRRLKIGRPIQKIDGECDFRKGQVINARFAKMK